MGQYGNVDVSSTFSTRFKRNALTCAIAYSLATLSAVATVISPVSVLAADSTIAGAAPRKTTYDIPAGPLEGALNRFGREAGILLSFSTEAMGLQSKGLHGSYTVSEALPLLLQGTGLSAVQIENGSYVLRAAPVSVAKESEGVLPTV